MEVKTLNAELEIDYRLHNVWKLIDSFVIRIARNRVCSYIYVESLLINNFLKKKREGNFYLRLLSKTAVATTTTMMAAAAIATYSSTGVGAVGGGATVGDAVGVTIGVGVTGGVTVGVPVGTTDGAGAADMPIAVSSNDVQ